MHGGVWDLYKISIFTKTPIFSSNKTTCRKSKKLCTKGTEWNNAANEIKKEKSLTISHAQHKTPLIPTPISIKEKEWRHKKKSSPTLEERESKKKREKTGGN